MNKHSSGPWRIEEIELHEGGKGIQIISRDGEVICDNQTFYPQELDPKNSHIIAAAPELLEALEDMVDYYAGIIEERDGGATTNKARNAIKKAKGETT